MAKKKRKQKRKVERSIDEAFAKFEREVAKVWRYPGSTYCLALEGPLNWVIRDWEPGQPMKDDEVLMGFVPFHKARMKAKKDKLHVSGLTAYFRPVKCLDLPTGNDMDAMFTVDTHGTAEEVTDRCRDRTIEFVQGWLKDYMNVVGAALNEKEQQS